MSLFKEFKKTSRHLSRRQRHEHKKDAPILHTEKLSMRYENGYALKDVSFSLQEGERIAIVGPNGAGKSTLLKIIAGVQKPTSGAIQIFGHAPDGHVCIAYVPQRSQVDWTFPVTVADVAMMGRVGHLGLFRNPKSHDWDVVHHALDVVKLDHLAKRQIDQLSGGQQQRMFIARALAQEAELMLMDEPMTGLDITSQEDIFRIMDELRARDVTVIVSLHDLKMASERFDRVMLLNKDLLAIGLAEDTLSPENLISAYGGNLQLVPTDDGMLTIGDTTCCEGNNEHA
ncbi:MAG: metal ABC transporter ATP-binding protein [Anaerolineae bacterium]|jgi:ABC-type Mn2+/Zn2+ transport system ATPase subunit|nr:metal ABC transporter ATP-binding protein [Anaerolineae bacterium]MBT4310088.1 metal ABC transporter ATP-binding protein [Anaerolineae bacterium]MBT4457627.1 metal ABC transporter ATP-binding protein [Anaerolineae bacterium]MBT4841122.1 metal ABC transporter ATP-binding protein [Anaerolineae bacterium]MBT6062313.1 metal ABC transporter ATP-binding protein [Anaerolineae bacterium]